jgi:hypothetical protein
MKRWMWLVIYILFWMIFTYIAIASNVFRFRNPELTETQLFLKLPDAMLWRTK